MIEQLMEEIKSGEVKIELFNDMEVEKMREHGKGWIVSLHTKRNYLLGLTLDDELDYITKAILQKLKGSPHYLTFQNHINNLRTLAHMHRVGYDISDSLIDVERERISELLNLLSPEGMEYRYDTKREAWGFFFKEDKDEKKCE